ncbi:MAG: amidase [Chloroflexi bacterium]|nr:amidase [Chloroflexota bacterium]
MTDTSPLHYQSITEQLEALKSGQITAVELVQACLARIDSLNGNLNSVITVNATGALAEAKVVDEARSRGENLPALAGIPVAVKDSIPTAGIRTTDNSRLLEDWVPEHDASAVQALKANGAIIIGKANLNEFGWSRPSEADLSPPPWNPWNPEYMSVGSSSGSGGAASSGMCSAAIGTDGGGSIRLPGGAHGLVGMKPTHGIVSRHGMDHNSHSEISPLTRTVADTALMLDAMATYVPEDDMSWSGHRDNYFENLQADVSGWRVGVPRTFVESAPNEPEVIHAYEQFLKDLESVGCELVDLDLRGMAEARMANFVVLNAETYQRHASSLKERWNMYGPITRIYLLQGAFLSAEDMLNAAAVGRSVRSYLSALFSEVRLKAIAMPTSPFMTAERSRRPGEHARGINACFTAPFNITGNPSVSIPSGISDSTGLPIGMMLTGDQHDDLTLLRLAHRYEATTEWHTMHPKL